jgi:hypothetical protein
VPSKVELGPVAADCGDGTVLGACAKDLDLQDAIPEGWVDVTLRQAFAKARVRYTNNLVCAFVDPKNEELTNGFGGNIWRPLYSRGSSK